MAAILIVDDDTMLLASLRGLLTRAGYEVLAVPTPDGAVDCVRSSRPGLILMDMNFTRGTSGIEGITLLRQVKIFRPEVPVILMTAWGSIDLAVEGMRAGAFDFITKPWDNDVLLERIATALSLHQPSREDHFDRAAIVGSSAPLEALLSTGARVAPTDAPVLITGESGTGKALLAETIHRNSRRASGPFVKVRLGGMPPAMFESEMFGIEKGVATGVSARRGLVEEASGGTLFLDELADMSLPNQAKLLRVLEEREVLRVGSARPVPGGIKVIAATNLDLRQAVARGRFREDLYYRLNVAELTLPPLRERGDDILLLARHLLAQHAHNMERAALTLAPATQQCLLAYDWPGNVRELSNEMERAAALTVDTIIRPSDLSPKLLAALARHGCIKTSATAPREPLPDIRTTFNLEQAERLLVQRALDACQGNKSRAAELLGITREGLRKKLLRLDKTAHGHDGEEA